ncbi:MAG: oxaloacetate-decarboxylating malate dehydrogenase, partial [Acidobacteriota bacterium]
ERIEELLPIIHRAGDGLSPAERTIALRRPSGLFISAGDRGRMASILAKWPERGVQLVLVTNGEHIQGLGDEGAEGMLRIAARRDIYTVCAGISPLEILPVCLDVGTDNEALLNSPFYSGLRQRRPDRERQAELMDELVASIRQLFPRACIQFEGLNAMNGFSLTDTHRNAVCCFSDLHGLAAAALAGLFSTLRIAGGRLREQKILFLGGGPLQIALGDLIVSLLIAEGMPPEEACKRCRVWDSRGFAVHSRKVPFEPDSPFVKGYSLHPDLLYAVELLKPTVIFGTCARPGTLTPQVLQAMAKVNERPIVFSFNDECTAEEAYRWTEGRALFASQRPFHPVRMGRKTLVPGLIDDVYVLAGLALGVVSSGARSVTGEMLLEASKALAAEVSEADLERKRLFPPLSRIREVSVSVAIAVADAAYRGGQALGPAPDNIADIVRSSMAATGYPSPWSRAIHESAASGVAPSRNPSENPEEGPW